MGELFVRIQPEVGDGCKFEIEVDRNLEWEHVEKFLLLHVGRGFMLNSPTRGSVLEWILNSGNATSTPVVTYSGTKKKDAYTQTTKKRSPNSFRPDSGYPPLGVSRAKYLKIRKTVTS
jgi:hypothetical protein